MLQLISKIIDKYGMRNVSLAVFALVFFCFSFVLYMMNHSGSGWFLFFGLVCAYYLYED